MSLTSALFQASGDIDALADELHAIAEHGGPDSGPELDVALALLAYIAKIRADLDTIAKTITTEAVAVMPYRATVPGLGEFVRHSGTKRNEWDNDGLTRKLVALALDERKIDKDTGEVLESEAQCVARVLSECARPNWRLTPLRARGIPLDEYCKERAGVATIELPPAKATP